MSLKKRIGIIQDREECYMCRDDKALKPYHMIPEEKYKKQCEEDGLMCYLCNICLEDAKRGFFKNGLIDIAQKNWSIWNNKDEREFYKRYPVK